MGHQKTKASPIGDAFVFYLFQYNAIAFSLQNRFCRDKYKAKTYDGAKYDKKFIVPVDKADKIIYN